MPIGGRVRNIDSCISDLVAALNAGGIPTVASCCGHMKMHGVISLQDGRELIVMDVKGRERHFKQFHHTIHGEKKNE